MYCEQMMREEGFDTTPEHRVMMHTDAIWRACRIILDVKLHRGEIGVDEAIDFLVEQTGFERPNAAAEVQRYTYTPTLPAELPARARCCCCGCARTRSGGSATGSRCATSTTRCCRQGSLPISFHRRASLPGSSGLAAAGDARDAGHPEHRPAGRSFAARLLARRLDRQRHADRPPGADRPALRRASGAPLLHLVDLDGARSAARRSNTDAIQRISRAVAVPLQVAGGIDGPRPDRARLRRRRDARRRAAVGRRRIGRHAARVPRASPATGSRSASTRGRSGWPSTRGTAQRRPSRRWSTMLAGEGVRRLVVSHWTPADLPSHRRAGDRPRHGAAARRWRGGAGRGRRRTRRRRRRVDPRRGTLQRRNRFRRRSGQP